MGCPALVIVASNETAILILRGQSGDRKRSARPSRQRESRSIRDEAPARLIGLGAAESASGVSEGSPALGSLVTDERGALWAGGNPDCFPEENPITGHYKDSYAPW